MPILLGHSSLTEWVWNEKSLLCNGRENGMKKSLKRTAPHFLPLKLFTVFLIDLVVWIWNKEILLLLNLFRGSTLCFRPVSKTVQSFKGKHVVGFFFRLLNRISDRVWSARKHKFSKDQIWTVNIYTAITMSLTNQIRRETIWLVQESCYCLQFVLQFVSSPLKNRDYTRSDIRLKTCRIFFSKHT